MDPTFYSEPNTHLQFKSFALVLRQQITNFLLIDFQIRSPDEVLLLLTPRDVGEDVGEGIGNDASQLGIVLESLHSKGFPGAGLAVSEDGAVESRQDGIDEIAERLVVEIHLLRRFIVDGVEGERFFRFRGRLGGGPWDGVDGFIMW